MKNGKYKIKWCDGDQVPRVLGHVVLDEDGDDNDEHLAADDSYDQDKYDDNEADQSDLWLNMD